MSFFQKLAMVFATASLVIAMFFHKQKMAIPLAIMALLCLLMGKTFAHDNEHPELTPWYQSLTSGKGPCCDGSDAKHLADVDWESKDGHYRVRIPGNPDDSSSQKEWVDVPDEAVVKGPNKDGRTLVWPMYYDGKPAVRCFMPGSMS